MFFFFLLNTESGVLYSERSERDPNRIHFSYTIFLVSFLFPLLILMHASLHSHPRSLIFFFFFFFTPLPSSQFGWGHWQFCLHAQLQIENFTYKMTTSSGLKSLFFLTLASVVPTSNKMAFKVCLEIDLVLPTVFFILHSKLKSYFCEWISRPKIYGSCLVVLSVLISKSLQIVRVYKWKLPTS